MIHTGDDRSLIPLTNGMFATVDAEKYETLYGYKWRPLWSNRSKTFYAVREPTSDELRNSQTEVRLKTVRMHRQITLAKPGQWVDHQDHNGLNNVLSNLRICTPSDNAHNRRKLPGKSSVYKGVSLRKRTNIWSAEINVTINGIAKTTSISGFTNERDAAITYDCIARKLHGEFAALNFPRKGEISAITGLVNNEDSND